ncbi:hypothetical protein K457DRAFT_1818080 [Linnemannia elongata AG-77]|uniref:Uncharacterized protein n=1 Tax=Linnemannia elongata AG-77 TaxID=1314771 RepID=A0A197K0C2_9FUNG|nr:hypothetical protein K457DRAFT_1818080 [Linnemannia elongata AG-77]
MHFLSHLAALASCAGVLASFMDVQAPVRKFFDEPLLDSAGAPVSTGVPYNLECAIGNIKIDYLQAGSGKDRIFTFELCKDNSCEGRSIVDAGDTVFFKLPDRPSDESRIGFVKTDGDFHWWPTSRSPAFAEPFVFKEVLGNNVYAIQYAIEPFFLTKSPEFTALEMRSMGIGRTLNCQLERVE